MKFKFEIIPVSKEDNDYKLFKNYEYTDGLRGGAGRYEMFRGTKKECLERKRELENARIDKKNKRTRR